MLLLPYSNLPLINDCFQLPCFFVEHKCFFRPKQRSIMANFIATFYTHTQHGLVAMDAQKTPKSSLSYIINQTSQIEGGGQIKGGSLGVLL